jgi:NhaP-type Na+/H+ or K+/H+ antiporter
MVLCVCFVFVCVCRSFRAQVVTDASGAAAFGNFFGILIGSTVIGIMFGLFVTFVFKYIHIANSESNGVQETAVLLLFAYGAYVFGGCCLP